MDARITRTRTTVLKAATDLLVEGGPSAVTVDAIVARSGVAKSTIYRHWESRDDILVSVIEHCAPTLVTPDPDAGFEAGLRGLASQIQQALNDPEWARIVPALLLLKSHQEDIADLEERLGSRQDECFEAVLAEGVAEGAIPADTDIELFVATLIGPMVFAHLSGRPAVTEEFAQSVVDGLLRANAVVDS